MGLRRWSGRKPGLWTQRASAHTPAAAARTCCPLHGWVSRTALGIPPEIMRRCPSVTGLHLAQCLQGLPKRSVCSKCPSAPFRPDGAPTVGSQLLWEAARALLTACSLSGLQARWLVPHLGVRPGQGPHRAGWPQCACSLAVCLQPRSGSLCPEFSLCLLFILRLPRALPSGLRGPGMRPARTSVPKGRGDGGEGVPFKYVIAFSLLCCRLGGRAGSRSSCFSLQSTLDSLTLGGNLMEFKGARVTPQGLGTQTQQVLLKATSTVFASVTVLMSCFCRHRDLLPPGDLREPSEGAVAAATA